MTGGKIEKIWMSTVPRVSIKPKIVIFFLLVKWEEKEKGSAKKRVSKHKRARACNEAER